MRVLAKRAILALIADGLTLGVSLALAGCGGEAGLAGVRGRVTYKGRPVGEGEGYFSPIKPGIRGAQGPLDSDGYYQLGPFAPGDGAFAGGHKVSVVSRGPDKPIPANKAGGMMPEDMQGT